MKSLLFIPILLLGGAILDAQTVIEAVADAASFAPRVSPGELASIFGSNLADSTQQASGFPLPHRMAGATVYINNASVPLLYVSETQINFQVPSSLATYLPNPNSQKGFYPDWADLEQYFPAWINQWNKIFTG